MRLLSANFEHKIKESPSDFSCHVFLVSRKCRLACKTTERAPWGVWELGFIPLSAAFSMMADEVVRNVKELMAKKDSIEKEIKELHDVLDSVSIQRVS